LFSFNAKLIPKEDTTREARTQLYGSDTWHYPHHAQHPNNYSDTTARKSFYNPKTQPQPNHRDRDPKLVFDLSKTPVFKVASTNHAIAGRSAKEDTHFEKASRKELCSGYTMGNQNWDGSGWRTEKNCHTDQFRTSYTMGFNQPKPFHKTQLKTTDGRF